MDLREQFIKSAQSSCRHFNGIQNDACTAGINYEKQRVIGEGDVSKMAMPCLPQHANGRVTWPCDKFEIMSQSDAEKKADAKIARMNSFAIVLKAAKEDAKQKGLRKGSGGYGELKCPICNGGTLRYSVAAYNGHMHVRCSTENCASWME
jgi:hypothetical protein